MVRQIAVLAVAGLMVAACAARPSAPVQLSQPGDEAMDCTALAVEIEANRVEAARLGGADAAVVDQNVAAGVVAAALFWPAMLATDLSNSEQIEMRALQDRNRRLAWFAGQQGCPGAG